MVTSGIVKTAKAYNAMEASIIATESQTVITTQNTVVCCAVEKEAKAIKNHRCVSDVCMQYDQVTSNQSTFINKLPFTTFSYEGRSLPSALLRPPIS